MSAGIVRSELWRSLLPPGVVAYETREFVQAPLLFDGEQSLVAKAVPKRVAEFAAGRLCARHALAELGHTDFQLLRDASRRPLWPDGIVGSITHTDGYCGAAVGRQSAISSIGIDAEEIVRLDDSILRAICTPEERARLEEADTAKRQCATALVFSAKEAFYKCHSAAGGEMLGFRDVALCFHENGFTVEPQRAFRRSWPEGTRPAGQYEIREGLVFCAVAFVRH
ncbi:MAG: 4'-phosphopantetheinyl transferase superfamily protein [Rhizomicrobium sp.]